MWYALGLALRILSTLLSVWFHFIQREREKGRKETVGHFVVERKNSCSSSRMSWCTCWGSSYWTSETSLPRRLTSCLTTWWVAPGTSLQPISLTLDCPFPKAQVLQSRRRECPVALPTQSMHIKPPTVHEDHLAQKDFRFIFLFVKEWNKLLSYHPKPFLRGCRQPIGWAIVVLLWGWIWEMAQHMYSP